MKFNSGWAEEVRQQLDNLPNEEPLYSGLKAHELRILKDTLPVGSLQGISKDLNISYNSVWSILEGKWNNKKVVRAAFDKIDYKHIDPELAEYLNYVRLVRYGANVSNPLRLADNKKN